MAVAFTKRGARVRILTEPTPRATIMQRGRGSVARLNKCLRNDRSVPVAFRRFTGHTTAIMADRLGVSRQSVEQCLGVAEGRQYPHIRRALEAEYGLPPHHLDKVL